MTASPDKVTARDIGGNDVFSSRAKLLWSPNEDVNLTLQYEFIRDEGDSPPVVSTSVNGVYSPTCGACLVTSIPEILWTQAGFTQP